MVPNDQTLLALKPRQVRDMVHEREVADVIDKITGGYPRVPLFDHQFVHRLNGRKGTRRKLDDPSVSKVVICGEPDFHVIIAYEHAAFSALIAAGVFCFAHT